MNEPVCGAVSLTDQRHCRYRGDRHHDTTHSLTTEESFVDLSDFRCCWFNFWCYHRATTAVVSAQIESQTMPRKFLLAWQVYEYDERWRWFWNIFHSAVFFHQAKLTLWKAIETISEPKSNRENYFHSLSYNFISHRPRGNTEQQNRQKKSDWSEAALQPHWLFMTLARVLIVGQWTHRQKMCALRLSEQ